MRRSILTLLVAAACCSVCSLQAAETVSIATLNCEFLSTRKVHIKYGLNFDERYWTPEQVATWTESYRTERYLDACEAIADAVERIDTDVIVLTEVGRVPIKNGEFVKPNDVTTLHALVSDTYPHLAYGRSTDTTTFQNVAILSKREFVEVEDTIRGREFYDLEFDDPDEERETGISKGMRVAITVDGDLVHIYAVHLKSERGEWSSDAQRLAQANIVRRHCLRHLRAGEHVMVVGDLNDGRGQPTIRRIRGKDDVDEDLIQTGSRVCFPKRGGETYDEYDARLSSYWTYQYLTQRNQIDHILISQSIRGRCTESQGRKRMAIEFIAVTEKITGEHAATDHRAVKLTLEFQDP